MTARKTRPIAKPAITARAATSSTQGATSRQQLVVATEGTGAMLRGFEAMRKINDRAMQGALVRFSEAAERLSAPHQPLEMLAIPGELVRSQIEGVASYWQELSSAAMEMQTELLGCSSHLVDSDAVLQTASAMDALLVFPFYGFDHLLGNGGRRTAAP